MVLHKFALLGGKVPAATGIRAAGRPPKGGRRTSFAAAAAPPGLGPAGSPENPAPPGAAVFGLFLWEGVRFLRLMFFRRLRTFCGRDRTDSPSPQGQANGSILSTLAACRFWAFAVGKNSPHPRNGKPMGSFYPPSPPVDFGLLQWGRKDGSRPPQGQGKRIGFYPLSPGSANCGVKSSPSRRRASSRAGCGGRAVK